MEVGLDTPPSTVSMIPGPSCEPMPKNAAGRLLARWRGLATNGRFERAVPAPKESHLQLCIPTIGNPFIGSKGSTDASSLRGPEALNHCCSIIGNPDCEMRLLVGLRRLAN